MRFLVTGATGFVGNNVVRLLLEHGHSVRVLTRREADLAPLAGLSVETAHGDIRDAESVRQAFRNIDVAIHAAGDIHIGWTKLAEQREINVSGTRHVAEAALEAGAKLVHVSSVNAIGLGTRERPADEETPIHDVVRCGYVITKQEAEQVVLDLVARGLHGVIVNPSFMLGPWDWKPSSGRMLLAVARRFTPIAPKGGVSVADVRDVAAGILAAAERGSPGRRYILAGHNQTYFELWKLIARLTGGRPPWMPAGPLQRIGGAWLGDLLTRITGREGDLNSATVRMSTQFHYYDSARARHELAYAGRPTEESVTDAWRWLQEHGYVEKTRADG